MELQFEYTTNIGAGSNPSAVHLPDNSMKLFYVNSGRLFYKSAALISGDIDFSAVTFDAAQIATKDRGMSYARIKNVPRLGLFGVWTQAAVAGYNPERQRFAIYDDEIDLANYVVDGSIDFAKDSSVAQISLTFENPSQLLAGEDITRVTPSSKLTLGFSVNGSEEYPMGVYYVDRVNMGVGEQTASLDGRNVSGKLLKDQTFNELNSYAKKAFALNVEDLLINAGVTNYDVQLPADPLTAWQLGMEFPYDMAFLDGLQEMISCVENWTLIETLDGEIIVGSKVSYAPIQVNSKYTFERDTEVLSRSIIRDDEEVYAKVCVHNPDFTLRSYKTIGEPSDWSVPTQKTLFVEVAQDTPTGEISALAISIADSITRSGTQETFVSPFRPQLLIGDEVEITSNGESKLLGIITSLKHNFGRSGYSTEFTVDSGGRKGKPLLKDLIANIGAKSTKNSSIKRL